MSLRIKILAQLKAKYPGVNLSKTRLDDIAAKLDAMITDEAEIDAKLDEMNGFHSFADIAKQDDQVRALQAKLGTPPKPPAKPAPVDPENPEAPAGPDEEPPKWAKGLIEEVRSLKTEKAQTGMRALLAEKLKDVPSTFYAKRALPEKQEDLDAFAEEVNTDYESFTQDLVNKGLAVTTKPANGADAGSVAAGQKAAEADIKKWAADAKQQAPNKPVSA